MATCNGKRRTKTKMKTGKRKEYYKKSQKKGKDPAIHQHSPSATQYIFPSKFTRKTQDIQQLRLYSLLQVTIYSHFSNNSTHNSKQKRIVAVLFKEIKNERILSDYKTTGLRIYHLGELKRISKTFSILVLNSSYKL